MGTPQGNTKVSMKFALFNGVGDTGLRRVGRRDQATVHVRRDQALTEGNQGPFAEGRCFAVEIVQHHLPAAIHGCGFDHFVIGDLRVGLEQGRQGQLGQGHRGLTLWLVLIKSQQVLLKGISKQRVAV